MNTEEVIKSFRNRIAEYNAKCIKGGRTAFIVSGMIEDVVNELRHFLLGGGSIGEMMRWEKKWSEFTGTVVGEMVRREMVRRIDSNDLLHGNEILMPIWLDEVLSFNAPNWTKACHVTDASAEFGEGAVAIWGISTPGHTIGSRHVCDGLDRWGIDAICTDDGIIIAKGLKKTKKV